MNKILQSKSTLEVIFPAVIMLLSLVNIVQSLLVYLHIPSLIVSILGILIGYLFFTGHKQFDNAARIWIIAQLPAITFSDIMEKVDVIYEITYPVFNTIQISELSVGVGLHLETQSGILHITLNIIPIFYFILFRMVAAQALIGKGVVIEKFRADNKLGDTLPLEGKIVKRVRFGKEVDWLLARTDQPFQFKGVMYDQVIIKPKDADFTFKPGGTPVVSFVLLVKQGQDVPESLVKGQFPFVDWGLITVTKETKKETEIS